MFCPYCATPLRANEQSTTPMTTPTPPKTTNAAAPPQKKEKVSNLWFLAPIIFSIFGGIVGYLMIRKRIKTKQTY